MFQQYIYVLLLVFPQITSYRFEVKVKEGIVIGTAETTIFQGRRFYAFYGVPYAKAPLGRLRFKDPIPVKKWKKPFDARTEYHGACAQPHITHKDSLYGNEDCLHLSIYTPELPRTGYRNLRPVIVWIHGYAFTTSYSHIHGADFLIDNDLVFVTVTHRIGAFGFLKANETDSNANMGLKDIVIALKWIRGNIKQFNGDYKRITVMGSGSGATFISWLLMTKARHLFSKLILQGGVMYSPKIFQSDHHFERQKLIQELKKIGVKNFMKASTADIVKASQNIYDSIQIINFQRLKVPFSPMVEMKSNKSLLEVHPRTFFTRYDSLNISHIPMLVGFNSQESIPEVIPFIHNPQHLKTYIESFKFLVPFFNGCQYDYNSLEYKKLAKTIKNEYFRDSKYEISISHLLRYTSDLITYPIYEFIKSIVKKGTSKVYAYKFNYVGGLNIVKTISLAGTQTRIKGAAGGDEICYILKCEPAWEDYVKLKNDTFNRDRTFIEQISGWWANFAKTGNPTPNSNPSILWKNLTIEGDNLMLIGEISKSGALSEKKAYKFWNEIYRQYYSQNCPIKSHDEL